MYKYILKDVKKEMKSKEESDERKINKKGKEEKYRIKKIKNK